MSDLTVLAGIVVTILLLACSAFFSSTETAVFSLSPEWITQQATTDDRRAHVLKELYDDPHRLLVTLLVGNNLVNIAIASIVTVLVSEQFPPGLAVVVTTVLSSTVILIFGEIVPKAFGLGNARTWSLTIAGPVRRIAYVLSPLISLFDAITRRMSAIITTNTAIERPYLD
jgi:Mg2+/Co2+ transporter CorB